MKNLIEDSLSFTNRHNLVVIKCKSNFLSGFMDDLKIDSINTINIGESLANELTIKQSKHLTIQVQELLNLLTEKNAVEVFKGKPKVVAFTNLGILFEPEIQLNVEKILKELSKYYGIILVWDAEIDDDKILHWNTQKENYLIDLSDIKPIIIDKTL